MFKRKALQRISSQERRFKEGDIIMDHIQGDYLDNEILNELEAKLGSMRLLIFSDNSNEILINHRFSDFEVESLKKTPVNMQYMVLDIFDKPKKYLIIMDN